MNDSAIRQIVNHMQLGEAVVAQQLCEQCLQQQPEAPDVLLLLAMSLQQQDRLGAAMDTYGHLTEVEPDNPMHWGNYGTSLSFNGDVEAAMEAVRRAVRLAPDDPQWLDQLGVLQMRHREPLAARDTLLHAFELAPESPAIRIHAASACVACGDYRADDLLSPWRDWRPLEAPLQYELADGLLQTGDPMAAIQLLEDLLRRDAADMAAKLLLANVYERVNRPQDAAALLERIVADGEINDPVAQGDLALQQAQLALRRGEAAEAHRHLIRAGPRDDMDYAHYFALARACDQEGDTAAAMRALKTAHERQIEVFRAVAPDRFQPGTTALPRANSRVTVADYQRWPALSAPDASQSPVFVVGFPRSGTTLLEQMLDAHPCLQSMDERPFFHILSHQLENKGVLLPRDLARLDQRDCDELRKGYLALTYAKVARRWDAQLVDKNPLNMLWLPMIHRLFPEAKFVLSLRHPCDVILSCYMQNFRATGLVAAGASLARLASTYVAAMECWLDHVDVFRPQVLVSRHEELVQETPREISRIAKFLGLKDADMMLNFDTRARAKGFIATPSYTQVIEPINSKGLNRWHRYREYLEPVVPILQPMLDHWGYTAPGHSEPVEPAYQCQ